MKSQYIFPLILFIPIAIIQLTLVPMISFGYISPDLILILLVYFALRRGQIYGSMLGFIFGLLFDLVSGNFLGSSMFSKTTAGFIAGYFYNENKVSYNTSSFVFPLIVFICATLDSILNSFFSSSETNFTLIFLIFEQGLMPGIYTSVISFLFVVKDVGRRIE